MSADSRRGRAPGSAAFVHGSAHVVDPRRCARFLGSRSTTGWRRIGSRCHALGPRAATTPSRSGGLQRSVVDHGRTAARSPHIAYESGGFPHADFLERARGLSRVGARVLRGIPGPPAPAPRTRHPVSQEEDRAGAHHARSGEYCRVLVTSSRWSACRWRSWPTGASNGRSANEDCRTPTSCSRWRYADFFELVMRGTRTCGSARAAPPRPSPPPNSNSGEWSSRCWCHCSNTPICSPTTMSWTRATAALALMGRLHARVVPTCRLLAHAAAAARRRGPRLRRLRRRIGNEEGGAGSSPRRHGRLECRRPSLLHRSSTISLRRRSSPTTPFRLGVGRKECLDPQLLQRNVVRRAERHDGAEQAQLHAASFEVIGSSRSAARSAARPLWAAAIPCSREARSTAPAA